METTIFATLVESGVLPTTRQKARHISSARRVQIASDARDFALANRDRAVGILELCGVLHVSRRTLQYCFEYAYDTTPQNYLRALRLNGVRRELSARERGSTTIHQVASSWGFWHMSQFAQDYRTLFGVLPSGHPARGRRQRGLSRLAPHRIAGMAAARRGHARAVGDGNRA